MPGGPDAAWPLIKDVLEAIAARSEAGPCVTHVGPGGSGHFVKMVHNGIEYGDMQLICEAYHLLRDGLGLDSDELQEVFAEWNTGELDSYLIEITRDILAFKEGKKPLVEKILDAAGQKGTGKWTTVSSLDLGVPVTLIAEATFARCLSALKEERVKASKVLPKPTKAKWKGAKKKAIEQIRQALYASKIVSYSQGFMLLREAAKEHKWELDYGQIALMWRGGCIIRSRFLSKIKDAYVKDPQLANLLLDPFFKKAITKSQDGWRATIAQAALVGIPTPAFSTALAFYDGYRCARLPANLLQAQRDYFGAHTYERTDKPRGEFFHTNWTGRGGTTASTTYNV
jgi:6-phosphogluconate dehydrogenase